MSNRNLIERICSFVDRQSNGSDYSPTEIAGFSVLRSRAPSDFEAVVYNPLLCLILQGEKETYFGARPVSFAAGQSLIVSHDLPIVSRVTQASDQTPYVAVVLELDMTVIRSLFDEIGEAEFEDRQIKALDIGETDAALMDAVDRLFGLVEKPFEAKVMAPLIKREIHFRLLLAQHGATLRQLLSRESHASRIAKAIQQIRRGYTTPLAISELAGAAGMSPSSFHQHFKTLTETTPLQYQKDLRLMEARRLLRDRQLSVSSTAFEVGYESPTQFSREYSRKFGVPPRAELTGTAGTGT
ncbi:MAG: AraC family transcriptional regulator [Alphaproteobacteria bacterium]|nr:AraC family transcriptional regulator [Alphaproteobacteria bacterium]